MVTKGKPKSSAEARAKIEEIKKSYFRGSTGTTVSKGGQTYAVGTGIETPALRVDGTPATSGGQALLLEQEILTRERLERERQEIVKQREIQERQKQEIENIRRLLREQEQQGKKTESEVWRGRKGEIVVQEDNVRQYFIQGGGYVEAPRTAKVRAEFVKRPKITMSQVVTESPAPTKPPAGVMEPAKKRTFEQKTKQFISEKEGQFSGILAGTGFTVYRFGKGVVKGATALFRPKFYTEELPQTLELLSRPLRGQYAPEIGEAIKQDPTVLAEMYGYGKGFQAVPGRIIGGGITYLKGKVKGSSKGTITLKKSQYRIVKEAGMRKPSAKKQILTKEQISKLPARKRLPRDITGSQEPLVTRQLRTKAETKATQKFRAKESKVQRYAQARETAIEEFKAGRKLTPKTPANIRKAVRQYYVGRNRVVGKKPDTSPRGAFAKDLPKYSSKYAKQKLKETYLEQIKKEYESGLRSFKDLPKSVRKQYRKVYAQEARNPYVMKDKPYPSGLMADIQKLPIQRIIIKKAPKTSKTPILRMYDKPGKPPARGGEVESGRQMLVLKKPKVKTKTKQIVLLEPKAQQLQKATTQAPQKTATKTISQIYGRQAVKGKFKAGQRRALFLDLPTEKTVSIVGIKSKTKAKPKQKQQIKQAQKAEEKAEQAQEQEQGIKAITKAKLDQPQAMDTTPKSKTAQKTSIDILEDLKRTSKIPPPRKPPVIFVRSKDALTPAESYKIEVRRGGVFKEFGTEPTIERAFFAGYARVKATAGASFRISTVTDSKPISSMFARLVSRKEIYASEKEPGVFIQKRERRIKTPGELGEITYKGIATLKARKASKRFNVFG